MLLDVGNINIHCDYRCMVSAERVNIAKIGALHMNAGSLPGGRQKSKW